MKRLHSLLLILVLSSPFLYSQENKWIELIKESLNFKIDFYGQPIRTIQLDKKHGFTIYHYKWQSFIEDPTHPNDKYSLDIYVFPDSLKESPIIQAYSEEQINDIKGTGNELQIENSTKLSGGHIFQNHIWKDKEDNYFQTYTGIAGNKLYQLNIHSQDGGLGGQPGIQFVNSFKLLYIFSQPTDFKPTYEINFPEKPISERYIMDDKLTKVSIETCETATTADSISPVDYYQIMEIQYPINVEMGIKKLENYYTDMGNDLLNNHNATLIKDHAITHQTHTGHSFEFRDENGDIILYQIYLIKESLYIMEIKLKPGITDTNNSSITTFFQSFKLKTDE